MAAAPAGLEMRESEWPGAHEGGTAGGRAWEGQRWRGRTPLMKVPEAIFKVLGLYPEGCGLLKSFGRDPAGPQFWFWEVSWEELEIKEAKKKKKKEAERPWSCQRLDRMFWKETLKEWELIRCRGEGERRQGCHLWESQVWHEAVEGGGTHPCLWGFHIPELES